MGRAKSTKAMMGGVSSKVPVLGDYDPMGMGRLFEEMVNEKVRPMVGRVVTYNPQSYTATVEMMVSNDLWTCTFIDDANSQCFGYSASTPPREGDYVAVIQETPMGGEGLIVGRIPVEWVFANGDEYEDPEHYMRRSFNLDTDLKKTNSDEIQSYAQPLVYEYDPSTHIRTSFRPTDIIPGEMSNLNQHNCGIKGGGLSCTLHGGGASVRVSALTNAARIVCEAYIRHSLSGTRHEFHNGRFLSAESDMAYFQEERLGWHSKEGGGFSSNVWTEDSEAPKGGMKQTMRARMKEYSGYFGHLMSKYFLRPDPSDSEVRALKESMQPKEEGVARETVDPSGQYRLSAAGMITIERTGRIPIPVRIALPTDKDHDIDSPEVLERFQHQEGDPSMRLLELYDRQAYDLKTQYARVDGLGAKKPDHYVPQEEELKPLNDQYDIKYDSNETVQLKKYDKRRAGVYLGEDGSVIIRDAWGSEIAMIAGNVSISCAGNIMVLPGQTALTIAGDDIVQKAQNSVDIHASEHDVRLSAARNMEIVGGADEDEHQGGVIIESKGKNAGPWDGEDKGEKAYVSGITLKSENQDVVIVGNKHVLKSKEETRIVSGDEEVDGSVSVASKNFSQYSGRTVLASDGAVVMVNGSRAAVVGGSVSLNGKSLNITRGSKTPGLWVDAGSDPSGAILEGIKPTVEELHDEKKASGQYSWEKLEKMLFGFRTSEECRTDKSWEIGASSDEFTMYEPAWVQVMKVFETLKDGGVNAKVYKEEGKWENGKPFPGKEAESSAKYAQIVGSKPQNLTSDGFNKSRKAVEKFTPTEKPNLKDEYKIRDV